MRLTAIGFVEARRITLDAWSGSLQNGYGSMLLDSLLLPLESTTHVPTVTVARELVQDGAMMRSR